MERFWIRQARRYLLAAFNGKHWRHNAPLGLTALQEPTMSKKHTLAKPTRHACKRGVIGARAAFYASKKVVAPFAAALAMTACSPASSKASSTLASQGLHDTQLGLSVDVPTPGDKGRLAVAVSDVSTQPQNIASPLHERALANAPSSTPLAGVGTGTAEALADPIVDATAAESGDYPLRAPAAADFLHVSDVGVPPVGTPASASETHPIPPHLADKRAALDAWTSLDKSWAYWLAAGGTGFTALMMARGVSRRRKARKNQLNANAQPVLLGWNNWRPYSRDAALKGFDKNPMPAVRCGFTNDFPLTGAVSLLMLTAFYGRAPAPISLHWPDIDVRVGLDANFEARDRALGMLRRRAVQAYGALQFVPPVQVELTHRIDEAELQRAVRAALAARNVVTEVIVDDMAPAALAVEPVATAAIPVVEGVVVWAQDAVMPEVSPQVADEAHDLLQALVASDAVQPVPPVAETVPAEFAVQPVKAEEPVQYAPMHAEAAVARAEVAEWAASAAPIETPRVKDASAYEPTLLIEPASIVPTTVDAPVQDIPRTNTLDVVALIDQAKRLLEKNRAQAAIDALQPLLASPEANAEAWATAGWSWWHLAFEGSDDTSFAATQAAHAFERALAMEPERASLLNRAIGHCHLARASHEVGDAHLLALDAGLEAMGRNAMHARLGDFMQVLEWASTLYDRAMLTPVTERGEWLDKADNVLRQFAGPRDPEAQIEWLQARILCARTDMLEPRAAEPLHARAIGILFNGMGAVAEEWRDTWMTRLIDAERAYIARLSGASRIARLKNLQTHMRALLETAQSITPLLAWVNVLGDWSAGLQGALAQAKLAEVEPLFGRIEALTPHDGGAVNFARAYYLRLRAERETGARRFETLTQAEQLLSRIGAHDLPVPMVRLETAEVTLARARLLDGDEARAGFARVIDLAGDALHVSDLETRALACVLTASTAMCGSQPAEPEMLSRMKALANRLVALTPNDANALRLAAQVQLLHNQPVAASELCDAAWRAGADRTALIPLWQNAIARWARSLTEPERDMHWVRLHQRLRMANSTT